AAAARGARAARPLVRIRWTHRARCVPDALHRIAVAAVQSGLRSRGAWGSAGVDNGGKVVIAAPGSVAKGAGAGSMPRVINDTVAPFPRSRVTMTTIGRPLFGSTNRCAGAASSGDVGSEPTAAPSLALNVGTDGA